MRPTSMKFTTASRALASLCLLSAAALLVIACEGAPGRSPASDTATATRSDTATSAVRSDASAPAPKQEAGTIWSGTSGGYRVVWTDSNLVVTRDGRSVIAMREILARAVPTGTAGDTAGATVCEEEYRYRVLSFVGGILALGEHHYWYCPDAAHPGVYQGFHAIDLSRTEREAARGNTTSEGLGLGAKLTDLFPEQEVIDALMADKLVRRRLGAGARRPATADELVGMLEGSSECEYAFEADMLNRWAIHHVDGDRVAVRIGLSHGCEAARGMITQIGILLKIPERLRASIAAAASGREGFLMNAAKRFDDRSAAMAWRYAVDDEGNPRRIGSVQ